MHLRIRHLSRVYHICWSVKVWYERCIKSHNFPSFSSSFCSFPSSPSHYSSSTCNSSSPSFSSSYSSSSMISERMLKDIPSIFPSLFSFISFYRVFFISDGLQVPPYKVWNGSCFLSNASGIIVQTCFFSIYLCALHIHRPTLPA